MTRRGLCDTHGQQQRYGIELRPIRQRGRICTVPECGKKHEAHGLCNTHYSYAVGRGDIPARPRNRRINTEGYAMIFWPGHPNAQKSGYIPEHVAAMSQILGRPLVPGENVHHVNGVRDDNRWENLELWVTKQPKGQRASDVIEWATEMLKRYAPDKLA
jgi:hypothetical protein